MSVPEPYRDRDDEVSASFSPPDTTRGSIDSTSTTSLILERINTQHKTPRYDDPDKPEGVFSEDDDDDDDDLERGNGRLGGVGGTKNPMEKKMTRAVYIVGGLLVAGWLLALVVYLSREAYRYQSSPHDPGATVMKPGKSITMEQVQSGIWRARRKGIRWINGEKDGLMLVPNAGTDRYLEVQDVRDKANRQVLVKKRNVEWEGESIGVGQYWPSPDLKHVLLASDMQSVGYMCWIFAWNDANLRVGGSIGDIRFRPNIGSCMSTRRR